MVVKEERGTSGDGERWKRKRRGKRGLDTNRGVSRVETALIKGSSLAGLAQKPPREDRNEESFVPRFGSCIERVEIKTRLSLAEA